MENADSILESVEVILKNVEEATSPQKLERVHNIIANVEQISRQVNRQFSGEDLAGLLSRLLKIFNSILT